MIGRNLAVLAVLGTGVLCGAEKIKLNSVNAWERQYGVTEKEGVLSIPGKCSFTMKEFFIVDPAKTYTLQASARSGNGQKASFMPTVSQYDAKGRLIYVSHTKTIPGTFTELAAPCKAGDTLLIAKNAGQWPKGRLLVLAFRAKEDSSDLPNYTLAWNTVKNIEKKGDAWEVRLTRALPFAAAAGTKLRLHENGGTMYPAGGCITGNSWQTLKGEIKGVEKASYSNNRWAPGAVKAKLHFLMNHNNENAITELKNIFIEIK